MITGILTSSDPSGRSGGRAGRWALPIVAVLTALAFVLRLGQLHQSLFADELSTYWIIRGQSLGHVLSSVRSNDEITPPLYFVLGWLSTKLGSNPDLVRLPSLLAGTVTVPLVYAIGVRSVGRLAGVLGAAIITLSPFLIFYSIEARSYSVMIALVAGSTLALLAALDGGGRSRWALYAVCACGAMLSHYTAIYVLVTQFAWVAITNRQAIRPLLVSSAAAVVLFLPWLPGFIADNNSPTTVILSALQPFSLSYIKLAVEQWSLGYPSVRLGVLPGTVAAVLILGGLAIAAIALTYRLIRRSRNTEDRLRQAFSSVNSRFVLVVFLALATPVGGVITSAIGPNVIASRNLNPSWPALALAFGALIAAAGPVLATGCTVLVLTGFGLGTLKAMSSDVARPDYRGVADFIEANSDPADPVVDSSAFTPVPLTGIDVYLPQTHPEFRLGLPAVDHPFQLGDPVPSAELQTQRAIRLAKGRKMFVIFPGGPGSTEGATVQAVVDIRQSRSGLAQQLIDKLPPGYRVLDGRTFEGIGPLEVLAISGGSPKRTPSP